MAAHGVEARIWSSGLSPWMVAAALAEWTSLASDFGWHRVMVSAANLERAEEFLEDCGCPISTGVGEPKRVAPPGAMNAFRRPWLVRAVAVYLLILLPGIGY
ncbi:MAG: hypothetical protein M3174_06540 [Actinomycetota bacterium]|nr:hypothetical protein [Actinomycetota bacterium]